MRNVISALAMIYSRGIFLALVTALLIGGFGIFAMMITMGVLWVWDSLFGSPWHHPQRDTYRALWAAVLWAPFAAVYVFHHLTEHLASYIREATDRLNS